MHHHLDFGGLYLKRFLSQRKFLDNSKVEFEFKENEKMILTFNKLKAMELKILVIDAVKYLINELEEILPKSQDILSSFEAFNFEKIINLKEEQVNDFGNDEIMRLANFYLTDNVISVDEKGLVLFQWKNLKYKLFNQFHKKIDESKDCISSQSSLLNEDLISFIFTDSYFQNGFESVLEILNVFCSLPTTNAEVERGFSCMKRIKTNLRNKLLIGTLHHLMMISLNGEDISTWTPDKSLEDWLKGYKTRNFRKDHDL